MTATEWGIVVGVAAAVMAVLGPWMFMVHAKLAALTVQLDNVVTGLEKHLESHKRIWKHLDGLQEKVQEHDTEFARINGKGN